MASSTWSKVIEEFSREQQIAGPKAPWARVLARKIATLVGLTKRPLVIYASACTTSGKQVQPQQLQIDPSDKVGFHDVLERIDGGAVDVLIHSPGGYAEATESIVDAMRRKFGSVRFIVPAYAKSAATMMVMSGDEIVLHEDAELGPIDPQMLAPNGVAPAEAIKEQFRKASEEITADPSKLPIWIPILQPMGPALLVQCDNAIELSKRLVTDWLTRYMFKGDGDAAAKAQKVATFLSSHTVFRSHARRVKLEQLEQEGLQLRIRNLSKEKDLEAAVWELYCLLDIVFANTPIYKLFYNSLEDAMVRQSGAPILQGLPGLPFIVPGMPGAPGGPQRPGTPRPRPQGQQPPQSQPPQPPPGP